MYKNLNSMESKKKDKRRVLLYLPLLVLPLLALAFYALGGGKGVRRGGRDRGGINTALPDAAFKKGTGPADKMGFYKQAEQDSARWAGSGNKALNTIGRPGFKMPVEEEQAGAIREKLAALHREISKPVEPAYCAGATEVNVAGASPYNNGPSSGSPRAGKDNEAERLEAVMKRIQEGKGSDDPEMRQLNGMLDKIMAIQNPALLQEQLKAKAAVTSTGGADSMFRAVPAIVDGKQKIKPGGLVKLKLMDTLVWKGYRIPRGYNVYGYGTVTNQRLLVNLKNIRIGTSILPVDLSVFSLDGMVGIDAPEAELGEAAGDGATEALQGMQLMSMDQSIGVQAAGAAIDATKGLLTKKVRKIRVSLKNGQQVLLRNNAFSPKAW
jgi:hypothetical protein